MKGFPFGKGRMRSFFRQRGSELAETSPQARQLVWIGDPQRALTAELATLGWRTRQLPDDATAQDIGGVGADVAIVELGDGDEARLAHAESVISACTKLQWLAVISERALSLPRVRVLVHDLCFDFLVTPLYGPAVAVVLGHAWGKAQLRTSIEPGVDVDGAGSDLGMVGSSKVISDVRDRLRKFAQFDMPALVTGETGTGKEVAARALHGCSARRDGPFVAINCGALPENLIQSELFGHERGAFTGATTRKIGRIEAAEGGVVLLDEIGDLPLEAQANLLRFLEEHTIERVGGNRLIPVDARVVAATHVDLQRAVREGRFREDLYYRLNVLHVHLPPLRERGGDAELLARYFLEQFRLRHRAPSRRLSANALTAVAAHPWPGNVRELINRVQRAAVTSDKRVLDADDLELGSPRAAPQSLQEARAQIDRDTIVETLHASGFNMSECARRLDISRVTLYRLCRKYQLKTSAALLLPLGLPIEPAFDPSPAIRACMDWLIWFAGLWSV